MNQEILQKLGIKISEMSCNSLKRIYSSQIQEWTNTSGKDAAAFIGDLVDERLISCKYDFQCECGNHCTSYVRKIERSSYKCPVCERSYSKDAIHKIGTLLFEVDKMSILEYCEDGNVDKNIRENIKVVPMTKRGDNDKMEIFIGSSSEAADYMDQISLILEGYNVDPLPWNAVGKNIFVPSTNTIDALFEITKRVDGAIFIFNADDKTWNDKSALESCDVVRDNVILEYGLFAGSLGDKSKVCFICKGKPKIASDLKGVTYIDGDKGDIQTKVHLKEWLDRLK